MFRPLVLSVTPFLYFLCKGQFLSSLFQTSFLNIARYLFSLSPLNTHADCQTDGYVDACIPIKLGLVFLFCFVFFKPCLEFYSLIFRLDFRHICYPHPLPWRPTQAPALVTHTTYHPQFLRLKLPPFFDDICASERLVSCVRTILAVLSGVSSLQISSCVSAKLNCFLIINHQHTDPAFEPEGTSGQSDATACSRIEK